MLEQPTLRSIRLLLRPLRPEDAQVVQELAGAATFAITDRVLECLVGVVGLTISATEAAAELGYWIGLQ